MLGCLKATKTVFWYSDVCFFFLGGVVEGLRRSLAVRAGVVEGLRKSPVTEEKNFPRRDLNPGRRREKPEC